MRSDFSLKDARDEPLGRSTGRFRALTESGRGAPNATIPAPTIVQGASATHDNVVIVTFTSAAYACSTGASLRNGNRSCCSARETPGFFRLPTSFSSSEHDAAAEKFGSDFIFARLEVAERAEPRMAPEREKVSQGVICKKCGRPTHHAHTHSNNRLSSQQLQILHELLSHLHSLPCTHGGRITRETWRSRWAT